MGDRHTRAWFSAVASATATAALLAGCTVGSPPPVSSSTAPPGSTPTVTVQDDLFHPAELTVEEGTTVVWEWEEGRRAHNVVGEGLSSDTKADGTFEHRFDEPGTYTYSCTLHAGMDGTVIVEPSA